MEADRTRLRGDLRAGAGEGKDKQEGVSIKVVLRPKKNFVFPLDFKTMLTKH